MISEPSLIDFARGIAVNVLLSLFDTKFVYPGTKAGYIVPRTYDSSQPKYRHSVPSAES